MGEWVIEHLNDREFWLAGFCFRHDSLCACIRVQIQLFVHFCHMHAPGDIKFSVSRLPAEPQNSLYVYVLQILFASGCFCDGCINDSPLQERGFFEQRRNMDNYFPALLAVEVIYTTFNLLAVSALDTAFNLLGVSALDAASFQCALCFGGQVAFCLRGLLSCPHDMLSCAFVDRQQERHHLFPNKISGIADIFIGLVLSPGDSMLHQVAFYLLPAAA